MSVQKSGGVTGKGWVKGQSGNPGGRPKGIGKLAREHGDKALDVLVAALADDDGRVRIAAAREILDRGYGKPVTMTADVTNRLEELDDDFLEAAIAQLRASTGAADAPRSRSGSKTEH